MADIARSASSRVANQQPASPPALGRPPPAGRRPEPIPQPRTSRNRRAAASFFVQVMPLPERRHARQAASRYAAETSSISALIASCAEPLREFDDPRFGELFDRFGDK